MQLKLFKTLHKHSKSESTPSFQFHDQVQFNKPTYYIRVSFQIMQTKEIPNSKRTVACINRYVIHLKTS